MMYERVENNDNAPEANHPSIVWDQIEPNSSQPRTPDLNTETTAEDLGQLPQLEITDGTPLLEASADTDDTARLVESSIQELVIAAYEQSAKLPPELGNTKLMEDLKREKESGEFGPASQKAFRILVETMQTMQLPQYLRALTEFGIPVPPGFPSAETNASEGLPLFSRRITAGERLVDLKLNLEKPSVEDVKKLNQVFEWLASADAGIKFHAERREIKFLQSRISELGVKSWEYKEGEDKQAWLQSAKSMVDLTDRVSNTIRAMHYLYKSSAEGDFPISLPEGSSITVVLDGSHHRVTLNKQDLEKAESRSLLKRGTIESIRLDLPADLRVDHLGNKVRIGNLQDWLDTNAKPVTETLMRLSEVRKEPQSIIYWGEDEISQGQAVFNSNGEFTGKLLPKGQTPEPGETTKHVNLVDYDFSVEEIKTGPDKGRLLIRQTIEAADAAPWAYQNIRWLGVDTVGKPLVIQHAPVDKDAFLPVRNGGTIELIQARNLETYRSGRKIASFGEKTVTGFMDTAMVVSGTIELRAAMKASQLVTPGAQAVLKLTERETLGQVNHGLFRVGLGGSGVLNNAGGKELQFGGMSGQDLLTLRSLIFVGEAAKGVGGTFSSALRTAEAPSLTTATEKVRTFIHGQKETALLPALPAWSPAARIHKAAEYTFRGTELALAPQITKELIHQLKELNEEKHSQAADEALSIHERLLGMGKPENGAFDSSSPESIAAARLLLNDYGRMITEGKNQKVKDSVAAIFKEVEKGLQPDTSKEVRAELVNKLAQDLILSKDELVRLEKVHPDFASSDKRQLNDKELSRLLSGSMTEARMTPLVAEYAKILEERKAHAEVNMARTIGLLYLTRSEDGKVPAKIESWLSAPRMEKTYQSESNQYKPKQAVLGETEIKQSISTKVLVNRLVEYSSDKQAGNNVITGGDVLVRIGVVDRLSYGLALQDVLASSSATREDKFNALFDSRGGRLAGSYEVALSQPSAAMQPGSRPADFIQRLRRDAATETDADVKAAMVALSIVFKETAPSDRVAQASWLNDTAVRLRSQPGELAKEVNTFLKQQADRFDNTPIARLDAAMALVATSSNTESLNILAKATDELIKGKDAENIAELFSPERLAVLVSSGLLSDRRRFERFQNAALSLAVPSEVGQPDDMIMKLTAGLNSLHSQLSIVRPEDRQKLSRTLRDLIDTESKAYAVNSAELRVFAINSLAELGDQRSLSLIRQHLRRNEATGDDATSEPSPSVRAAALKGLEKLKDPELPLYVAKLAETENDPAILEMIATAKYDVTRSELSPAQFKEMRDRLAPELLGPQFFDGTLKDTTTDTIKKFFKENDFQLLESPIFTAQVAEAIDSASTGIGRLNFFWSRASVTRDEMSKLSVVHNRRRSQLHELANLAATNSEDGKLATIALEKILTDKSMTVFLGGSDQDFFKHQGEYDVHTTPQLPFERIAAKALRANSAVGSPNREVTQWAVKRALMNGSDLSTETIVELVGALKELRKGDRPAVSRSEAVSMVMHVFEENITRLPKEQSEQAQAKLIEAMMEFNDRSFMPVLDLVAQFSSNPNIKRQAAAALDKLRDSGALMWRETPVDTIATAADRTSAASKALLTGKDTEVVVQTLFNAYKGQSITESDPALTWIRRALTDNDERIQLAATRILLESKLPTDHPLMKQASTNLSKIAKDSKRGGLRFEALELFGGLSSRGK